jgi:hypothetical protein
MGENRSLDDFLSSGDGTADAEADGTDGDDGEDDGDGDAAPDAGAAVDESDAEESDVAEPTTAAGENGAGDPVTASARPTDAGRGDDTGTDTGADGARSTDADGPVDPLRATYRWSPEGDDCPACGRHVERRWRDGDRFVCADCKEW